MTPPPSHDGGGSPQCGNPYKGKQGLDRLLSATRNSLEGLRVAYREESAFRQETWACVALLPAAFWLGRNWTEWVLLVGSLLIVLIVELLNSGIEAAIDRVSYELHDLSKRAKDLASAAVLLSLVLWLGVWGSLLIKRLS